MEAWEQHILKGLQARHALYVESVDDVMTGHMHLHSLYLGMVEKNEALKTRLTQQQSELESLRQYRVMKEGSENSTDMELKLGRRVAELEGIHKEMSSDLSNTKAQLSDTKVQKFDLEKRLDSLTFMLEKEQAARKQSQIDLSAEITKWRQIAEEATEKGRSSAAQIDTLQARCIAAENDVKALAEEKFRLQSQLLTMTTANNNSNSGNVNNKNLLAAQAASGLSNASGSSNSLSPTNNNNNVRGGHSVDSFNDSGALGGFRMPTSAKQIIQDAHGGDIQTLCYSEGSHRLFSGGYDKTIKLFDCSGGTGGGGSCRANSSTSVNGTVMCLDSRGQYVIAGLSDNTCRLYTISGNAGLRPKCSFTSHTDCVDGAYLSLDMERAYSTSRDCTIRCWNVVRESISQTTMCTSTANDICLQSSVIASAHRDRSVRFWDTRTGRVAGECQGLHDSSVTSVRFLNDGRFTVSLSRDNTARICDVRTLREVGKFSHEKLVVANNYMKIAVSPDSSYVAFPSASDGCVLIWEPASATAKDSPTVLKGGHNGGLVNSVTWSDDGKHIASCGSDKRIVVWC